MQMAAARKSLARARVNANANTSASRGILSRDPVVVDTPARPLTIQVNNDLPSRQPAAGRPHASPTVDSDLYRDPQSVVSGRYSPPSLFLYFSPCLLSIALSLYSCY